MKKILFSLCVIHTLARKCGANSAGVSRIYLANVEDNPVVEAANTEWTVEDDITFDGTAGWHEIPYAAFTADLMEKLIGEADGQTMQRNIPFTIPKFRPALHRFINDFIGVRCLAIIVDNNGQHLLVGSVDNPLRLVKADGALGKKGGDMNGWALELQGEGPSPSYFYTGAVTEDDDTPES